MTAVDKLIERIAGKLLPSPEPTADRDDLLPDWMPEGGFDRPPRDAAVLIGLVRRGEALSVLYTERSPELRSHSGQIAFPGGKVDPGDSGPGAAALREAGEEVGIHPDDARILGYMPAYFTGSNYLITPVVAEVRPRRDFVPNPGEVKSVFEVPLALLLQEESFGTFTIRRKDVEHRTWQIVHEGLVIWGITANLTRRFYERVLKGETGVVISAAVVKRLREADWLQRAETQRLFALLDGPAGRTRAVGGVVRDTLLERPRDGAEIDFATELLPDEVTGRARDARVPAYPTGIEHGTVTLRIGELTAEVTTLREDVETDGRHAVVRFGTDWRRDAERRDFTLNALYAGMDGKLFDPIGGVEDCLAGVVRFIGDPDRRIAEDRLRVYRFFRFSASHGQEQLDADGLAAVRRSAGDLGGLSAERVGSEMRRMLDLPRVTRTLRAINDAGIEPFGDGVLDSMLQYERHARKPSFVGRLSLLLDAAGAATLRARWRLSNDEVALAEATLAAARMLIEFRLHEAAYRRPAVLAEAVDVAATLAGWTEAGRSAVVEQLQATDVPRFPVSGGDLIALGLAPGPALGAELERLERRWIDSGFSLEREQLLDDLRV